MRDFPRKISTIQRRFRLRRCGIRSAMTLAMRGLERIAMRSLKRVASASCMVVRPRRRMHACEQSRERQKKQGKSPLHGTSLTAVGLLGNLMGQKCLCDWNE